MSALPGQDVYSWKNTLKKVMMLKPEHISAYSLIIEEGTPFYERFGGAAEKLDCGAQMAGTLPAPKTAAEVAARAAVMTLPDLPAEDTDREMYHLTKEMMSAHGYERYEISNYAKKGMSAAIILDTGPVWSTWGLALAHPSYTYGYRYHNTENLQEYLSLNLYEGGAAARDIEELSLEDKMEEFMFVGLRMMKGVSGK